MRIVNKFFFLFLLLWLMNSQFTSASENRFNLDPKWSPDGKSVAFMVANGEGSTNIFVIDVETYAQRQITGNNVSSNPVWSPNSQSIAYLSRDEEIDLFIVNLEQLQPINLTDDIDESVTRPSWSADGEWILFTVDKSQPPRTLTSQIWITRPDGSEFRNLIESDEYILGSASWSSDTKYISAVDNQFNQYQLIVIDVSNNSITPVLSLDYMNSPTWSPINDTIVFNSMDFSDAKPQLDIWSVDSSGENLANLTNSSEAMENFPKWSPQGDRIAFRSSLAPLEGDLMVMRSDGSEQQNLTSSLDCNVIFFSWSPDGNEIAFDCGEEQYSDIWLINADGTNLRNLTGTN